LPGTLTSAPPAEAPVAQRVEPESSIKAQTTAPAAPPVEAVPAPTAGETVFEAPIKPSATDIEPAAGEEQGEEEESTESRTLEQLLSSEVFRFEEDSGKGPLSVLRFAEDILPGGRRGGKTDKAKTKKKRRTTYGEDNPDEPS